MSATSAISVAWQIREASSLDQGTAEMIHKITFPGTLHLGDYETGTGDNQWDLVWSDRRSLVATSEQLDLRGGLNPAIGGTALQFVELVGMLIINRSTVAASVLLVGGGANPAFSGLFGATGDIIKVGPSGYHNWFSPIDGAGLLTTAGTADMLTIDSQAATIIYDICFLGRSA